MVKGRNFLIWSGYFFVFSVALYLIIIFSVWFGYEGKIKPGAFVAGVSLSGLTEKEAIEKINNLTENFIKRDPIIFINEEEIKASDLALNFKAAETIAKIKSQQDNPFDLNSETHFPIIFEYDENALRGVILVIEVEERRSVKNPKLANNNQGFVPGQDGQRIIHGEAVNSFELAVGGLQNIVEFKKQIIEPTYNNQELQALMPKIEKNIKGGLNLNYNETIIKVDPGELLSWVSIESTRPAMVENSILIKSSRDYSKGGYFSGQEIENYLKGISSKINKEPVNSILGTKDDSVTILSPSIKGLALDITGSTESIISSLNEAENHAQLVVESTEAKINEGNLDELGLIELVASGYSNFARSPLNRKHNIRVGAEKFNGMLLSPGKTFSFTANMGEISAANGYLPELVIINNETRPEYGGGLCQVSTTAFRAALNAGFPIVARKAHSYPVQYYQPYGTDATIYNPNPDLKFDNDTGRYLLIQTRIVGNYLYFDFYGTKKNINVKFAGNKAALGAVDTIEKVTPHTYAHGGRGPGSFKAVVYRFIYDEAGRLIKTDEFFSNYDSPDKYPR